MPARRQRPRAPFLKREIILKKELFQRLTPVTGLEKGTPVKIVPFKGHFYGSYLGRYIDENKFLITHHSYLGEKKYQKVSIPYVLERKAGERLIIESIGVKQRKSDKKIKD